MEKLYEKKGHIRKEAITTQKETSLRLEGIIEKEVLT